MAHLPLASPPEAVFARAGVAGRLLGGAVGRLGDERVEARSGELGTVEDALGGEEDVAGEEDAAVLVDDLHAGGAGEVAGGVKGELDLVARPGELLGVVEAVGEEAGRHAVDLLVGEERVVGDAFLLAFPDHHVGGVVQHPLDEHVAGQRHDGRRVGLVAHEQRQRADVIEVAVRDQDEVQFHALQRPQVRGGDAAHLFRVQAAVDDHMEIPNLDIK